MEKKPVHLKPLIEASRRFLRASIPSTIEIRKRILADTDAVLGDETQIYQILLNMCTNAAHAMEKSGGILDIRLENRLLEGPDLSRYHDLKPGPYLVLKVKDTGEGMSPEILERVFEPYFTTKAPGKGTGMGLAVVHGIVKSHGGDIKVQSEAGKGTLFEILLPELKNQNFSTEETAEAIPGGNERILFVDDELSIVSLNVKRLTRPRIFR